MKCQQCGSNYCDCRLNDGDKDFLRIEREANEREDAAAEQREKREQRERDAEETNDKPLLSITFTGGRYKRGGLDADALKSIVAIIETIKEIAVNLYAQDNPDVELTPELRQQIKDSVGLRLKSIKNIDDAEGEPEA